MHQLVAGSNTSDKTLQLGIKFRKIIAWSLFLPKQRCYTGRKHEMTAHLILSTCVTEGKRKKEVVLQRQCDEVYTNGS